MVCDDRHTPAQPEQTGHALQTPLHLLEFAVHLDPESLKNPSQRFHRSGTFDDSPHGGGKLPGGRYRARTKQRPDDSSSFTFFAKFPQNSYEMRFFVCIDDVGGGSPLTTVHPHVQELIRLKTETPCRIVQLMGRHTEVKENAVNSIDSCTMKQPRDVSEGSVYDRQPVGNARKPATSLDDGLFIPVDADQSSFAGQALGDRMSMTASPESAVHIDTVGRRYKERQDFLQQDRSMIRRYLHTHRQGFC